MKISIGCDHGGFALKQSIVSSLSKRGIELIDYGTYNTQSVDYPLYAKKVCSDVQRKRSHFGVLICTTGVGMSIAANKQKGIRAALVHSIDIAKMSRLHNNCNVICLGANYTSEEDAAEWVYQFINSKFEGGRHIRRIDQLEEEGSC